MKTINKPTTTILNSKPTRNNETKQYIGTYKVYRVYRTSNRKQVIERGLTLDEAKRLVNSFPDSSRSMVVFTKQFTADKYFK